MDFWFGLKRPEVLPEGSAWLTSVHGNAELSVVRSILEGEGIPYCLRDRGAGGVVRIVAGDSPFACDVLVPVEALDAAKEILDAYRNGVPVEGDELEETEE